MASSKNAFLESNGADEGAPYPVKNGVTVNAGDYLGLYGPSAAADNGKVDKWTAAAGQIPLGHGTKKVVGDGTKVVPVRTGTAGLQLSIAGATTAAAAGKPFYATDENTYTLTAPATKSKKVGTVVLWLSGTTCWGVFDGIDAGAATAGDLRILPLFAGPTVAFADGTVLDGLPILQHCTIESFYAQYAVAPTTNPSTTTLKLQISPPGGAGYVDVGAPTTLVLAYGDTQGQVKSSAAIAAANVAHEGDLVRLIASGTTTLALGHVNLFMKVRRRAGV